MCRNCYAIFLPEARLAEEQKMLVYVFYQKHDHQPHSGNYLIM